MLIHIRICLHYLCIGINFNQKYYFLIEELVHWNIFCLSIYFHSIIRYDQANHLDMQAHCHLFPHWIYHHILCITYLHMLNYFDNHNLSNNLNIPLFIIHIFLYFLLHFYRNIILSYSQHLIHTLNLINDQHNRFYLQDQLDFLSMHLLCIHNY